MKIFVTVFDEGKLLGSTWLNNCTEETETTCSLCERPLGWSFPLCDVHLASKMGLEIKPSKVHGLGLFSLWRRKKGMPVCPLAGEVRSDDQLNNLYSHKNDPDCVAPYCVRVATKRVDAFRLRYAWVFVNHDAEATNCEFKKDGIFCTRDVEVGQELLINYGAAYRFESTLEFKYTIA